MTIRIAIVGWGNLGRGVAQALAKTADMMLVAVFTRRDPAHITGPDGVPVLPMEALDTWRGRVDVLALCGGSKTDLPTQTPQLAAHFNVVDSFDTHAKIPQHFAAVDTAARDGGRLALISAGWDPGLFSLQRALGEAIVPDGASYTFWGRGVSQGHSDALRRIPGVADAVQYTVPDSAALAAVRSGNRPDITATTGHKRQCFVVLEAGADAEAVQETIVTMPDYFADYETDVQFISAEELAQDHGGMPHGGVVVRSGHTDAASAHHQLIEYRLALDSNPEFTASVLTAYARAVARLAASGLTGAVTVFDIPPGLLSPRTPEELRAGLL